MNILQYRELVAQEAAQKAQSPEQPAVPTQQVVTQSTETQAPAKEESKTPAVPEKITIDGVGEVTLDELKNGYLRQSDYTQKTQDVSKQRKEAQDAIALYEQIKRNPQLAEQIKQTTPVPPSIDPATARVVELETKLYDMMLEREIDKLHSEFGEFEIRNVLKTAQEKGITNLRDAYLLTNQPKAESTVSTEDMKKQLRQQIMQELEAEKSGTQTIITQNGNVRPVETSLPSISPAEQKVARGMKMADADYIKWRDAGKRKS